MNAGLAGGSAYARSSPPSSRVSDDATRSDSSPRRAYQADGGACTISVFELKTTDVRANAKAPANRNVLTF